MFIDPKFFGEMALRDVSATTDQAYTKDAGAHTNGLFIHIESKIADRIGSVAQLVRAHP